MPGAAGAKFGNKYRFWQCPRGGRSDGPYTDSLPLSDHFQGGGGGLGVGGGRGAAKRGGSYISKQGHLSKLTPTKTKYGNHAHFQLGITSLKLKVHQQTVNHITQFLLKEGPKPTNEAVLYALSQPTSSPNVLQSFSVDSANFINISLHNVPNSNRAPLTPIPLYTSVQIQFECFLSITTITSYSYTRTNTHPTPSQRRATGTIIKQNPTSTDVDFGHAIMALKSHHRFEEKGL